MGVNSVELLLVILGVEQEFVRASNPRLLGEGVCVGAMWSSGARCAMVVLASAIGLHGAPVSVMAQETDDAVEGSSAGLRLRWHLQGGVNAVSEGNLYWNLADTAAPESGFDSDANWLELYVKPGMSFERQLVGDSVLYGKLSAVASFTGSTDAFDASDTGRATLEEAYFGYRTGSSDALVFDVSLGARELKLGTGMLISNGASSGFERGALKFGPRKAWERSAIARISRGDATGTVFYLDPNELPSNDSGTELAGVDLRYDASAGGYLGISYLQVLESGAPYPQAAPAGVGPPTITPGARDNLKALNLYAGTSPFD